MQRDFYLIFIEIRIYHTLLNRFKKLIKLMSVETVSVQKVYRARTVNLVKDVNAGKGIIMKDGNLSGGFDEINSRIAPPEYCKIQKLSREGEQVFYIAEEGSAISE